MSALAPAQPLPRKAPSPVAAPPVQASAEGRSAEAEPDQDRELPLFLQGAAPSAAGAAVQHQCAACAAGGAPCPKCAAEEEEKSASAVQKKEAANAVAPAADPATTSAEAPHAASPTQPSPTPTAAKIHTHANSGVHHATSPLPHLATLQQSFGGVDLSRVRTQVGGSAESANRAMGSDAYTTGSRIGFRQEPDLRLAAHEATHVLQQARGVHLREGVGQVGDPYERQANAVADSVARGESAQPLLEPLLGSRADTTGPDDAVATENDPVEADSGPGPVQHRLSVDATRILDGEAGTELAEAPGNEAAGGGSAGAAKPEAKGKSGDAKGGAAGKGSASDTGGGSALDAAGQSDPAGQASGAKGANGANGASGGAPGGAGGGNGAGSAGGAGGGEGSAPAAKEKCPGAGVLNAHKYDEDIEEPDPEPEDEPADHEKHDAKEEVKSESPEAAEVDHCPVEAAINAAAPPGAGAGAAGPGAGPAPAPASSAPADAGAPAATAATAGGPDAGGSRGGGAEAGASSSPAASAAGGGGGDAGGDASSEEGGAEGGADPLEAAIAAAETGRDGAVGDLAAADGELDPVEPGMDSLSEGARFSAPPEEGEVERGERRGAETVASGLFTTARRGIGEAFTLARQTAPDRLGELATSIKGELGASRETQRQAISARHLTARLAAHVQSSIARGAIHAGFQSTVQTITEKTTAALKALTTAHTSTLAAVASMETGTLSGINGLYSQSQADHRALGPKMGAKAVARGAEYAAAYSKFKIHKKDSFFAGYLTDRRAQAQIDAATKTAEGYQKSLTKAAEDQAKECVKGRQKDRCGVIAAARKARETADTQYAQLTTALLAGSAQALIQAVSTRESLLASVRRALRKHLRQLASQERRQRQSANDTCYLQQVAMEQAAHGAAAGLVRSVAGAIRAVQAGLTEVQTTFAGAPAPDPTELGTLTNTSTTAVRSGLARLVTQSSQGLEAAEARLAEAAGQGLAALLGVTSANDQQASGASTGFAGEMSALAKGAFSTFRQMREGYAQQAQGLGAQGVVGLTLISTGFITSCVKALGGVSANLAKSLKLLEDSLQDSLDTIDCEQSGIPKQAHEAASHEQPAWKSIVKWVLIIAIIVVVALVIGPAVIGAVGAMAASAVGAGAVATAIGTVVGGAIVGAAASATIQVVNNWASGQKLLTGVGRAAIMGAIGGAFGAGAGALIGKYVTGAVAQFALNVAADAVLEVATSVITGEFSWEGLGMSVLMSVVTGGFGEIPKVKGIQAKFMYRGAKVIPGAGAKAHAANLKAHLDQATGPRSAGGPEAEAKPARPGEASEGHPRPVEDTPSAPKGEAAEPTPTAPRPTEDPQVRANESAEGAPARPAPEGTAARPVDAPKRTAHPDHPEVEEGVVAKQPTADGHEVKVLRDGRVVTCSECGEIRNQFPDELSARPDLREKLDQIEALSDPQLKSQRAAELRAELNKIRDGSAGTPEVKPTSEPDPSTTGPKPADPNAAPAGTPAKPAGAADADATPVRPVEDVRQEIGKLEAKKAKGKLGPKDTKRLESLKAELEERYRPLPNETPEAQRDRLFGKDPRESLADYRDRLQRMENEVLDVAAKGNQEGLLDDYLKLRQQVDERIALPERRLAEAQKKLQPALDEQARLRKELRTQEDRYRKADSDRAGAQKELDRAQARGDRDGVAAAKQKLENIKARQAKISENIRANRDQLNTADRAVRDLQAEVQVREREARGISKEHYEYLRGRTPNSAIEKKFGVKSAKGKPDPVYGKAMKEPSADHIVSMKEITQMEGFSRLTTEQQAKILNDPENFMVMEKNVNSSKQDKTWSEWEGHPDFDPHPLPKNHPVREKMIGEEARIRGQLRQKIKDLAGL